MTLSPLTADQTMLKVLAGSHALGSDGDFLIQIKTACEGTSPPGC
jgi:hypothetical protein